MVEPRPNKEFGKRKPVATPSAAPVKRSGHVGLLLMGTLAVIVLYLSVNVAYHLVVPRADMIAPNLGGTSPVATLFAQRLLGPIGVVHPPARADEQQPQNDGG